MRVRIRVRARARARVRVRVRRISVPALVRAAAPEWSKAAE